MVAPAPPSPAPGETLREPSPEAKKPEAAPEKTTPRTVAGLKLTEQGRTLLMNNQPDDAIRVLEQAMNLSPTNGQNYYYLSEAWLIKGNIAQAREFSRLAVLYLEKDPEWKSRVLEQKARIERRLH